MGLALPTPPQGEGSKSYILDFPLPPMMVEM